MVRVFFSSYKIKIPFEFSDVQKRDRDEPFWTWNQFVMRNIYVTIVLLESWVLIFKTTLPELYQNYLANDFSLKMAHGEDTCLHSITAAKYREK
jgi:hypothetical protein